MAHTLKDIDGHKYVDGVAHYLKKLGTVKVPEWADIVKLSSANQHGPYNPDWFYTRCAAVLRHLYLRPSGVGGLSKAFGRNKRYGVTPNHHVKAHTNNIRKAIQAMEKLGYVTVSSKGGRELTPLGRKTLDHLAVEIHREMRKSA
ncbi:40S ribosomal protein S19 [Cichlidogyrus casuarinus]|uniref:Small ribosomal subunit protein eS19 n=1 Tax=Cichlidogyrus casuarinus TaxID=1844966 RepID=A0ABD2PXZ9_9PLAT